MLSLSTVLSTSCRIMNDHYSLGGFINLAKATIATMKFARHFAETKYFNHAIKNFELQKDLLYATLFFQSAGDFVQKTVTPNLDGTKTTTFQFVLPGKDLYDIINRVILAIGNFIETIQCAMKFEIVHTPTCITNTAERLGNWSPFGGRKFNNITVLQKIVQKPKDVFIFVSDVMTVARYIYEFIFPNDGQGRFAQFGYGSHTLSYRLEFGENVCKLISSIGKMILISTGNWYGATGKFRCVELATQWASEVKFVLGNERKRLRSLGQ